MRGSLNFDFRNTFAKGSKVPHHASAAATRDGNLPQLAIVPNSFACGEALLHASTSPRVETSSGNRFF
jgi:hypothetical protein